MKKIIATIATILATGSVIPAFAATYNVEQNFTGTFTDTDVGVSSFTNIYNMTFASLISGDASLFSSALNTVANGAVDSAGLGSCTGVCTTNETLINGDHIFGTFTFNSQFDSPTQVSYTGVTTITGGTGLFAGATGTGTFSGVDTYLTANSGTSTLRVINRITTPDVAAVPEPETYALMLAGLGLIGFCARRKAT